MKKGALVFVDGDISIDKYQDEASGKILSSIRIVQSSVPCFELVVDFRSSTCSSQSCCTS